MDSLCERHFHFSKGQPLFTLQTLYKHWPVLVVSSFSDVSRPTYCYSILMMSTIPHRLVIFQVCFFCPFSFHLAIYTFGHANITQNNKKIKCVPSKDTTSIHTGSYSSVTICRRKWNQNGFYVCLCCSPHRTTQCLFKFTQRKIEKPTKGGKIHRKEEFLKKYWPPRCRIPFWLYRVIKLRSSPVMCSLMAWWCWETFRMSQDSKLLTTYRFAYAQSNGVWKPSDCNKVCVFKGPV